jgi:GT2 family glycosyltransferase
MKMPRISVVIPTYERPDDLERCLNSLDSNNQTIKENFEIVVSDDSLSLDSKKLVNGKFPSVSYDEGKRNGPAGNRNAGANRATGNWIVFIDDDCFADPQYLKAYLTAIIQNPKIEVFEGRIYPDRPKKTWAEGCPANEGGGMLWTSNLCIKKTLFDKLGGLDERFKVAFEDVDLSYRLKKQNITCLFIPEAAVCHPWRTLRKSIKNWKTKGYQWESLYLFLKKHPESVSEYGNPLVYMRHALRMITKDLFACVFILKGRGIDILFSQLSCTLLTMVRVTLKTWKY